MLTTEYAGMIIILKDTKIILEGLQILESIINEWWLKRIKDESDKRIAKIAKEKQLILEKELKVIKYHISTAVIFVISGYFSHYSTL